MPSSRSIGLLSIVAIVVLAVGGLAFLLSRDGGDSGSSATPTRGASGTPTLAPETAADALSAAADRWDATDTAHFALTIDGQAFIDDERTIELRAAEGDIARPDLVEAQATIAVSLVTFNLGIIAVGDTMYQTNLVTGRWERAPDDFGYNPAVLFSPTEGIGAVARRVQNAEFAGSEVVGGRATRIVTGVLTGDDVSTITAGALEGDIVQTKVWVADDNSDIVKVELRSEPAAGSTPTTWTLLVTNQNQPVTIEEPQV